MPKRPSSSKYSLGIIRNINLFLAILKNLLISLWCRWIISDSGCAHAYWLHAYAPLHVLDSPPIVYAGFFFSWCFLHLRVLCWRGVSSMTLTCLWSNAGNLPHGKQEMNKKLQQFNKSWNETEKNPYFIQFLPNCQHCCSHRSSDVLHIQMFNRIIWEKTKCPSSVQNSTIQIGWI